MKNAAIILASLAICAALMAQTIPQQKYVVRDLSRIYNRACLIIEDVKTKAQHAVMVNPDTQARVGDTTNADGVLLKKKATK